MKYPLYRDLALAVDLPELRLRRGDIVRPVEHHVAPDGSLGYSVEVLGATGRTLGVLAIEEDRLEPLREDEVLSARAR